MDKKEPVYTYFDDGKLKYGMLLCYEFTDICARSLYKNRTDIIFVPEYNKDTSYFSNIIETMTRDIHAFIVQSNTSIYGDSRITGPYSRDYRNIVQIKGGENDNLIIGTVNVQEIKDGREKERNDLSTEIHNILAMNDAERKEKKKEILGERKGTKIARISANTFN